MVKISQLKLQRLLCRNNEHLFNVGSNFDNKRSPVGDGGGAKSVAKSAGP
jgi:hypothetical protein